MARQIGAVPDADKSVQSRLSEIAFVPQAGQQRAVRGLSATRALLARPFQSVGWKIMAPYIVLTAIIAVVGSYLVTRLVTGSLEERFTNQMIEASHVTSDSVVRTEKQQLAVVRNVAFSDGLVAAMQAGDADAIATIVSPLAANSRSELIAVVDAHGNRLYGEQLPDAKSTALERLPAGENLGTWAPVRSVLAGETDARGDKFSAIVDTGSGYSLVTAASVKSGDNILGAVLVGSPLASLLPAIKGEALTDVTMYGPGGAVLASTFAPEGDSAPRDINLAPAPSALKDADAGVVAREEKQIFGRGFDLLYSPLQVRGANAGYYSVALPSSYIATAGMTAQRQMAILFAAVALAVMFIGFLIARSLTGPLHQLMRTADAVTAGDLTARTRVNSNDEIGGLARRFDAMTGKLQRQHLATIGALASAIDARDPYTAGHSIRVGRLAAEIGAALGLGESTLQHLEIGGYLHDIGKIGVPDSVLMKEGTLDDRERALIERHPGIGLEILRGVELSPEVIAVVGGHHEKLDGSGYPLGLKADEITIFPRIAAVADIYDAVTTDRPYRTGMTLDETFELLQREALAGRIDLEIVKVLRVLAPGWQRRCLNDPMLQGYRPSGQLFKVA
jgi:putative nucleotidyltransferase with HDIG domain